jgi:hypothetical protein
VLAVLTLAVHPFRLPDFSQPINLELLPRITLPEMPTVQVQLKPRPKAEPRTRAAIRPQAQALPKAVQVQPQPAPQPRQLLDVARPQTADVEKPVEVERRAAQAPRLQTQPAVPQIPEAPPEPVQVTRPAPALSRPLEVPRAQAQGQARPLDSSRNAPALPQVAAPQIAAPQIAAPQVAAPASEAPIATAPPQAAAPEAAASPSVQVLTNQNVIQAPVEIRPRERAASAPGLSASAPGAAEIASTPGAQGGGLPPGGGLPGGGAGGRPGAAAGVNGINGGFGSKGLRMTLGCENPDTYKLTPEERAACLQRFAQRGRAAPDLGLNIPAAKQIEYDHYETCHRAIMDASIPGAASPSDGTSIRGLGANPSLKECGRGTR